MDILESCKSYGIIYKAEKNTYPFYPFSVENVVD